MEQTVENEIAAVLAKDSWTMEDCDSLRDLLARGVNATAKFRAALREIETANPEPRGAAALKIGLGRYILCRFQTALEALTAGTDNKDRRFAQALCHKELRQYDAATEEFERARDRGWVPAEINIALVEVQALRGDLEAAGKALNKIAGKTGETADVLYLRGLIDELAGWGEKACEEYEQARSVDASHVQATFRLAYYYDLHGEEQRAMELYRECLTRPPVHINALLNLAVLYEDAGQYDAAATCLGRILTSNPEHGRARLFLRDVEASKTMYFDEDQARRIAKCNAVLDIPVTDFELSVRARNCLKKMNIRSLGDLVNTTETELLAYKNFGETSLREIREMLSAKGLRLGQDSEEEGGDDLVSDVAPRAAADAALAVPMDRVQLSIRARRTMESLNISTLGELADKSEAELLACKNFGQSSLNEVRERLAEYGLQLRQLD